MWKQPVVLNFPNQKHISTALTKSIAAAVYFDEHLQSDERTVTSHSNQKVTICGLLEG